MADYIPIGRIRPRFRGVYSAAVDDYTVMDVVLSTDKLVAYMAISSLVEAGKAPASNPDCWAVIIDTTASVNVALSQAQTAAAACSTATAAANTATTAANTAATAADSAKDACDEQTEACAEATEAAQEAAEAYSDLDERVTAISHIGTEEERLAYDAHEGDIWFEIEPSEDDGGGFET